MAVYAVDSEQLAQATAMAQTTSERVRADVSTMLATLTSLQSTWTGSASAAFQGVVEQWRSAQRTVEQSLDAINATLAAAGTQYAETEMAAMSMFR